MQILPLSPAGDMPSGMAPSQLTVPGTGDDFRAVLRRLLPAADASLGELPVPDEAVATPADAAPDLAPAGDASTPGAAPPAGPDPDQGQGAGPVLATRRTGSGPPDVALADRPVGQALANDTPTNGDGIDRAANAPLTAVPPLPRGETGIGSRSVGPAALDGQPEPPLAEMAAGAPSQASRSRASEMAIPHPSPEPVMIAPVRVLPADPAARQEMAAPAAPLPANDMPGSPGNAGMSGDLAESAFHLPPAGAEWPRPEGGGSIPSAPRPMPTGPGMSPDPAPPSPVRASMQPTAAHLSDPAKAADVPAPIAALQGDEPAVQGAARASAANTTDAPRPAPAPAAPATRPDIYAPPTSSAVSGPSPDPATAPGPSPGPSPGPVKPVAAPAFPGSAPPPGRPGYASASGAASLETLQPPRPAVIHAASAASIPSPPAPRLATGDAAEAALTPLPAGGIAPLAGGAVAAATSAPAPLAEPGRTFPPEAASVARQVRVAIRSLGPGVTEIRLDPPELGHLRLDLRTQGAVAHLVVAAEQRQTLDLLRSGLQGLTGELRALGYERVELTLTTAARTDMDGQPPARDDPRQAFDDNGSRASGSGPDAGPDLPLDQPATGRRVAQGALDLRL